MIHERLTRPVLYLVAGGDPERAHHLALSLLSWLAGRPLLSAAAWRWYASPRPRWPVAGYGLFAAAVVAAGWWWLGWLLHWLPSPWAGAAQVALAVWLYVAAWYVAACRWWLLRLQAERRPA